MTVFADGDRITPDTEGCQCTPECCFQRVGIAPACGACGCAPFDDDDQEDTTDA